MSDTKPAKQLLQCMMAARQAPITRLHGSLMQAQMRMAPPDAIGATAALI